MIVNSIRMTHLLAFFLTMSLISCGKGSDYVNVQIITPMGMNKKFHELKNEFLSFNENSVPFTLSQCEQSQIYIGYKEQTNGDQVTTKRVSMMSSAVDCVATSDAALVTCLNQSSSFPPSSLNLQIKKNQDVRIGMMGAYYTAVDSNPIDGKCDDLDSTTGISADSLTFKGNTLVNLSVDATIPLKVWAVKTFLSTDELAEINSVGFNCPGDQCDGREFYKIKVTGAGGLCRLNYAEYLLDLNGMEMIHHSLDKSAGNASGPSYFYFLPRTKPMTLNYKYNGGTASIEIFQATATPVAQNGCVITVENAL